MLTIATTGLEDYLEGGKGKIKLLITGGPGAGKTRFSSFAPRPLYAACEDGLMSVADRKVPYASINSVEDMDEFLALCEAEAKKPEAQRRFETVVVDTIDAYQRTIAQQYLTKKKKAQMEGFEDWGWLDAQMVNLVSRLMLLPMNIIVLCHTKEKKGGKTDIDKYILKLQGDIKDQLPADFDFVGMFDNEFGAVDGKRGLVRSILWEPQPNADWLKARGGGLTTTPVVFAESDFAAIRDGIRAQLQGLTNASVVAQTQPAAPAAQPLPAGPGGPVGTGHRNTAPAQPTLPAPTQAAPPPAAARPEVQTPVAQPPAAVPAPVATPVAAPATEAEAVGAVQDVLGGKVIEDTANSDPIREQVEAGATYSEADVAQSSAADAEADVALSVGQASEEATETPVATPDAVNQETPAAAEVEQSVPAAAEPPTPGVVPNDAENFTVPCGTPRYTNGTVATPGIGCGKPLTVTLAGGRIVGAEEGQNADLVEITGLRTKAFLHNSCYSAAKSN